MHKLANAFLFGFLADGVLSLLDELLQLTTGVRILSIPRGLVALAVSMGVFVIYFMLALTPRLPKRVFLPATLFIGWTWLGAMPLPLYTGLFHSQIFVALIQLVLGAGLLLLVRNLSPGQRWYFTAESLEGESFSLKNTLLFGGANILLGPPALILFFFVNFSLTVSTLTAGFVTVGPSGIYAQQRAYERDGKSVQLIGMIHVGNRAYYDEVRAELSGNRTVVLSEGVTDRQGLLKKGFSYNKLANQIGLDAQQDVLGPAPAAEEQEANSAEILRADLDVSDFSESTVTLLNGVNELLNNKDFAEGLQSYLSHVQKVQEQGGFEDLFDDLLHKRNACLLEHLDRALQSHDRIVVPWGAGHMPGLEAALLERGFKQTSITERCIIGRKATEAESEELD